LIYVNQKTNIFQRHSRHLRDTVLLISSNCSGRYRQSCKRCRPATSRSMTQWVRCDMSWKPGTARHPG